MNKIINVWMLITFILAMITGCFLPEISLAGVNDGSYNGNETTTGDGNIGGDGNISGDGNTINNGNRNVNGNGNNTGDSGSIYIPEGKNPCPDGTVFEGASAYGQYSGRCNPTYSN